MRHIGVGTTVVLIWVLMSLPLGMFVGSLLHRRDAVDDEVARNAAPIPRQRDGEPALPTQRFDDAHRAGVAADLRASVRSGVTALSILVGAVAFTVGTAAAVSTLPGPTPPAVAGVIDAVTPFRVDPEKPAHTYRNDESTKTEAAPVKRAPAKKKAVVPDGDADASSKVVKPVKEKVTREPASATAAPSASPPALTMQELELMSRSYNTTDLSVTQSEASDPVAAGTDLVYTITVANAGPNPADPVEVTDTLPADVTFKSSTGNCTASDQTLICHLGELTAGQQRSFTITVGVSADLAYTNGDPRTITNTVALQNLGGPDSSTANNTASETTQVSAVADVRVNSAQSTSPVEVLLGEPTTAELSVAIDNLARSTPVDTVLTPSSRADGGLTVTPAGMSSAQTALAGGSPRTVSLTSALTCTSPGLKTVQLTASLALKNAVDVDPDLSNNAASASFQVDCVVPIAINVRPGGSRSSLSLSTEATVAALTTDASEYGLPLSFDANSIDVSRTLWGLRSGLFNVARPTGAEEVHAQGHPERSYEPNDRTRDADTDLVLHFKPSESGLTRGLSQACLKGKYRAPEGHSYTFLGCESVRVLT